MANRKGLRGSLVDLAKNNVEGAGIFLLSEEGTVNESENIFVFSSSATLKDFGLKLLDFYNLKNQDVQFEYKEQKYRRVRLIYFLRFNKVLCDVFVKINEEKHIKILKREIFILEKKFKSIEIKISTIFILIMLITSSLPVDFPQHLFSYRRII